MMLRVLQINLHHSKVASANLIIHLAKGGHHIVLIQEPWVSHGLVCGLRTQQYKLMYARNKGNPRACVLIRKGINAFMLSNYSDTDQLTISLESGNERMWLSSCYLAHDHEELPRLIFKDLVAQAQKLGAKLIIGADVNAHHEIWGSTDTNARGECLFDYLIGTKLQICNKGNKPTFVISNRQEVLDATFAFDSVIDRIRNWKVLEEHSFSDHRYISFEVSKNLPKPKPGRNIRKTDWERYIDCIGATLGTCPSAVPQSIEGLENLVDKITYTMNAALAVACPIRRLRGKPKPKWWTVELSELQKTSRSAFNEAKKTRLDEDWKGYKDALRIYKKEIRIAQRQSWKSFCEEVEGATEASRLRKILAGSPQNWELLQKSDGTFTTTSKESLELLLDTHFPGCSDVTGHNMEDTAHCREVRIDAISEDRLLWAIESFKPFKSPGPDGIYPVELQKAAGYLAHGLLAIFKGCFLYGHIPLKWRQVKIVFIPKAGRNSHTHPKDLRPISLSSFLLKTLERLIEFHLSLTIDRNLISTSQHAYTKGKSVETALHNLIYTAESSLHKQEFTLAAFLDIEGAFNNVEGGAITAALTDLRVEPGLVGFIGKMLNSRIIEAELGESVLRRLVSRGTPQGGVLSPFLWNAVVNKLLLILESVGCKVIAYADDVVIAVSGKFVSTLRDLIQNALDILSRWAGKCGLGVNPDKTQLILFTRKHRIPQLSPITLKGEALVISEETKYLGLNIDRKLTWKSNTLERVRKANLAFYACKRALGKTWGIKPKVAHWLYTAVVRPILLYGNVVWWCAMQKKTYSNLLNKVQRSAELAICGVMKTTPSMALDIILHLPPLDLFCKYLAACSAVRLKASSQWKTVTQGHSTILDSYTDIPSDCDYHPPILCFERNFLMKIPSRLEWFEEDPTPNTPVKIYTDGSKMDTGVGSGLFCEELSISESFKLPDHCSVFQAEINAIHEALKWLKINRISSTDICILSDSQAALRALDAFQTTSRSVLRCRQSLNEMAKQYRIILCWVPGHRDIPGNCRADQLAREGTCMPDISNFMEIPLATCKLLIKDALISSANQRWISANTCEIARQTWPRLNLRLSKSIIKLNRLQIRTLVGALTGHCLIGNHARRLGVYTHDFCRSCRNEEELETIQHLFCTCPALARSRNRFLKSYFLTNIDNLYILGINNLLRFVKSSGWFNMEREM